MGGRLGGRPPVSGHDESGRLISLSSRSEPEIIARNTSVRSCRDKPFMKSLNNARLTGVPAHREPGSSSADRRSRKPEPKGLVTAAQVGDPWINSNPLWMETDGQHGLGQSVRGSESHRPHRW